MRSKRRTRSAGRPDGRTTGRSNKSPACPLGLTFLSFFFVESNQVAPRRFAGKKVRFFLERIFPPCLNIFKENCQNFKLSNSQEVRRQKRLKTARTNGYPPEIKWYICQKVHKINPITPSRFAGKSAFIAVFHRV